MLKIIELQEPQTSTMSRTDSEKKVMTAVFRRAFLRGAGSVLSLRGPAVRVPDLRKPLPGYSRDWDALYGDWERVGEQLMRAADRLKN